MGKYSSSTYRVCPTMQWIDYDSQKLQQLLDLVMLDGVQSQFSPRQGEVLDMRYECKSEGNKKSCKEKPLRPTLAFLEEMIKNEKYDGIRDSNFDPKRASIYLAALFDKGYKPMPKNINVLEGNTYPDFFIKTDSFILVGEGKWTEKATTTRTKFLEHRNQMIRHIQGAQEYARNLEPALPVYGFYIVSEDFLNNPENQYIMSSKHFQEEAINKEEIKMNDSQELRDAYKGYTTWEEIEKALKIGFKTTQMIDSLPGC